MAIQIWDAQAGQYKSADLARFGGSGTLTEALVWDGTQYVKVWPTGPSYTWSDDFTSPTLHERWTLQGGTYTPPGLSDATVAGPEVGGEFTLTVNYNGQASFGVADASDVTVGQVFIWPSGDLALDTNDGFQGETDAGVATGKAVSLRRAGGQWHVLIDGQPATKTGGGALVAPDTTSGPAMIWIGSRGGTVTRVEYTEP